MNIIRGENWSSIIIYLGFMGYVPVEHDSCCWAQVDYSYSIGIEPIICMSFLRDGWLMNIGALYCN